MCNLSKGIYDEGMVKGISEGLAKGMSEGLAKGTITKAVEVVNNLISKGFSLDEALAIAGIDKEAYEKNCS